MEAGDWREKKKNVEERCLTGSAQLFLSILVVQLPVNCVSGEYDCGGGGVVVRKRRSRRRVKVESWMDGWISPRSGRFHSIFLCSSGFRPAVWGNGPCSAGGRSGPTRADVEGMR